MKLIGQREGDEIYLIDLEDRGLGFVFVRDDNLRYPPAYITAIVQRGYWSDIDHDPEIVNQAMAAQEVVPQIRRLQYAINT